MVVETELDYHNEISFKFTIVLIFLQLSILKGYHQQIFRDKTIAGYEKNFSQLVKEIVKNYLNVTKINKLLYQGFYILIFSIMKRYLYTMLKF